ncbi:pyocin activator PrtN family protein [Hyphomicrobium sp. CS1BSMeth3]|uniref:pyocin activator PrtN family protein n=1 Tax=Hyphomicrobium sp. CS1BSMeth3 TaxID=1892844 RepID=UPI0009305ADC|nr:pyocin activator PrtN family protein [Hyphomicrobium sp. CS1BSMeth3]
MEQDRSKTIFFLMALYGPTPLIPVEDVCRDFFGHLTPAKLLQKTTAGEIALPITRIDPNSQKTAKYVAITHLAEWLDTQQEAAHKELPHWLSQRQADG